MNIIFLDTETTDKLPEGELVQLAYKNASTGEILNELYNPKNPITFSSMAVHHITQEMVVNKPEFQKSPDKEKLQTLLKSNYLVAHNALFDIEIIKKEGVETHKFIDTLRVAGHLIDSEQYNLQYLRYFLGLKVKANAHDAWGDILVLEELFYYLVNLIKEKFGLQNDEEILKQMEELSNTPIMIKVISFGKYKGMTFEEVFTQDRGYLEWLYNSESSKEIIEQNENLIYTLENLLKG